MTRSKIALH